MLSKSIKTVKILLLAIFAFAAIAPALQVEAASPPLSPGCYWRAGAGDFEPINCPTEGLARGASGPNGACYLTRTQNGTVFFSVRCSNFALIEDASRNLTEAQKVCDAVSGAAYWNPSNDTCYYGERCEMAPTAGGTMRYLSCSRANVQTMYERYVRNELTFDPPASSSGSSSSSSSGDSSSGSSGSSSSSSSGDSDSGGPPSVADPESDCKAAGGEWRRDEGQEEPSCQSYVVQTNDCQDATVNSSNCGIMSYLVIFINVLSALAGVVIVGSIVVGGMQYSAAGSDPSKVSAAKARIRNAVIALLLFLFGYGMLGYLIPGGLL